MTSLRLINKLFTNRKQNPPPFTPLYSPPTSSTSFSSSSEATKTFSTDPKWRSRFRATAWPTPGIEETRCSCFSLMVLWVFLPWAWGLPPLACCSRLAVARDHRDGLVLVRRWDDGDAARISRRRPGSAPRAEGGTRGPGAAGRLLVISYDQNFCLRIVNKSFMIRKQNVYVS
jgi:hypothetical protein